MSTSLTYTKLATDNTNHVALAKDGGQYTITATPKNREASAITWKDTSNVVHSNFSWKLIVGDERCKAGSLTTVTKPATYIDTVYKEKNAKIDITVAAFTTVPAECGIQLR